MAQLSDDCFAVGGDLLGVDAARRMIFERIAPVPEIETIPARRALGRTLAQHITASIAIPGFDNSAVDGYAVNFDDLNPSAETQLRVKGRAAAGHPYSDELARGTALRIFTGAALPDGADAVMMQEDCERVGDVVTIRPGIKR